MRTVLCSGLIFSLLILAPVTVNAASSTYCLLSGKTLSIDFTFCPDYQKLIDSNCRRTRQRVATIGGKVLLYYDEVTPEGTIFQIGQRIEVTNDPEQRRFLFGQDFDGVYQRAWVTASYSAGELRLETQHNRYLNSGVLAQEDSTSYVFDILSCSECKLVQFVNSIITGVRPNRSSIVSILREQTCRIRDGV